MAKKRTYAIDLAIKGRDLFSATFKKLDRAMRFSPLMGAGKAIGGFIEKVPGLTFLGAGLAKVGSEMKSLALDASDFGSKFNDLAAQSGIGARALQEVAYAADQAGVPFDEFRAAVQRMAAVLGKGLKARDFTMLGKNAAGFVRALKGAKTSGAQFEVVLAQMAQIPDATKRAAFGMRIFGRAGVKLAALAGDGADGIRKMREEAQRLGLVMGDDAVARADAFGDTWAALGKTFEGLKRDFGSGLIEGLLPGMEDLLRNVKDNRAEIGAMVRDLGKDIGGGIVEVGKWLPGAFQSVKGAVEWLTGNSGLLAIGGIFTALMAHPLIATLVGIVASIKWLIDNTPKAATQSEKDKALLDARKKDGTLGGAMAVMGGETQGQSGPLGWAAGLMGAGAFVADEDRLIREAEERQRRLKQTESDTFDQTLPIRQLAENALQFSDVPGGGGQSIEKLQVEVVVKDPGDNVDGDATVKTQSKNVKSSTKKVGTRTTSHLKGGG